MTDLPPGWARVPISDVADVRGGIQKQAKRRPVKNKYPFLRVANVARGSLKLDVVHEIELFEGELERYALHAGDLLVVEGNGSAKEIGRAAMWNGEIENCVHQNHLICIRPTQAILPKYLELAWNSPDVIDQLWQVASTTSGLYTLSTAKLKRINLSVPPLAEQRRIVATLEGHLSDLVAANQAVTLAGRRTQVLWASVLNALASKPYGESTSDVPLRAIAEVAQVQGGIQKQPKRRPVNNFYPFLRVANVSRGGLNLSDVHQVELFGAEIERYRLKRGDLLVVEGNGSPEQIGRAAMWHDEIPNCVHQNHLIRVRPGPELDPGYLEHIWNAPRTAQEIRSVASSTSGLFTLSTAKVKSVRIPVPSLSTQKRLVAEVQQWRTRLDVAEQAIGSGYRRANTLRRSLLREAFAGRLVEQDPADEPASVLLERIRAERAAQGPVRRARRGKGKTAPQEETLV
ncbi:restriction endonuclease subunit S [Actinomadura sp. NBRC 104412]|uniref:restriction endonuclease subunit S n=1 Tax=Actinomadura sp. NBRC 104412 TaxID=3032203 RepID=UPI002557785A|nr:restriction endonuclease subunit S [Actinomadura sp. NBRC 104412]